MSHFWSWGLTERSPPELYRRCPYDAMGGIRPLLFWGQRWVPSISVSRTGPTMNWMKVWMSGIVTYPAFYPSLLVRSLLRVKRRAPLLQEPAGGSSHHNDLISSSGCGFHLSSLPCASPSLLLLHSLSRDFCQSHSRESAAWHKDICINLGPQAQLQEAPKGSRYRLCWFQLYYWNWWWSCS